MKTTAPHVQSQLNLSEASPARLAQVTRERDQLKGQIDSLAAHILSLGDSITDLRATVDTLEDQLSDQREEAGAATALLRALNLSRRDLKLNRATLDGGDRERIRALVLAWAS